MPEGYRGLRGCKRVDLGLGHCCDRTIRGEVITVYEQFGT